MAEETIAEIAPMVVSPAENACGDDVPRNLTAPHLVLISELTRTGGWRAENGREFAGTRRLSDRDAGEARARLRRGEKPGAGG